MHTYVHTYIIIIHIYIYTDKHINIFGPNVQKIENFDLIDICSLTSIVRWETPVLEPQFFSTGTPGTCIDWDSPEHCPCGDHGACGADNYCEVKTWCPSLGH